MKTPFLFDRANPRILAAFFHNGYQVSPLFVCLLSPCHADGGHDSIQYPLSQLIFLTFFVPTDVLALSRFAERERVPVSILLHSQNNRSVHNVMNVMRIGHF